MSLNKCTCNKEDCQNFKHEQELKLMYNGEPAWLLKSDWDAWQEFKYGKKLEDIKDENRIDK